MKRIFAFILVLIIVLQISVFAYAENDRNVQVLSLDPSVIAGLGYAIPGWNNLEWIGQFATSSGYEALMQQYMSDYAQQQGSTLTQWFVGEVVRNTVGQLVVAQDLYNKVNAFGDWLSTTLGLNGSSKTVAAGDEDGFSYYQEKAEPETTTDPGIGWYLEVIQKTPSSNALFNFYYNGKFIYTTGQGVYIAEYWVRNISILSETETNVKYRVAYSYTKVSGGTVEKYQDFTLDKTTYPPVGMYGAKIAENEYQNRIAPDGYNWVGDVGYTGGETLEDIIQAIFTSLVNDTLDVTGIFSEVAPGPTPGPTPVPPSPYPQAETELDALNTNIDQLNDALQSSFEQQQQFSQMLENQTITNTGINDLIGANHDILDSVGDIAGTLDGVQEGVQSIEGTLEGIGTLTGTIAGSLDIIGSGSASGYKFDLRTLFPFCIPFDVVRILKAFDGATRNATAPHIQIPMNFGTVIGTYTWDLDFSVFDPVAAILRQAELLVFAVGLAIATNKMIRW